MCLPEGQTRAQLPQLVQCDKESTSISKYLDCFESKAMRYGSIPAGQTSTQLEHRIHTNAILSFG